MSRIRRAARIHPLHRTCLVMGLLLAAGACSDDNSSAPEETLTLEGTWVATTYEAMSSEFIEEGMTLRATFFITGSYLFQVTGDLADVCGGDGPNCTTTGNYTSTDTQITIDAEEPGETTFDYTLEGDTMRWEGTIGEELVVVTWIRPEAA